MMSWRVVLFPFSLFYGAIVVVRNWLFDIGILPKTKVSIPVISVGNISAGGVGKTPLVQYLAERLREKNKVAVISRGYRRESSGYLVVSNGIQRCAEAEKAGDEASQMAERLDGVVVIVDEKRTRAADRAVKDFKAGIIVLDDGFQHRYLHRDLDILVLGSEEIFSGDFLLPAGNRREPLSGLKRANLVGISRCNGLEEFKRAKNLLPQPFQNCVFGFRLRPGKTRNSRTREVEAVKGKKSIAFSGIGHPRSFEETLSAAGIDVKHHFVFGDHHKYSEGDFQKIEEAHRRMKTDVIVTTEKDNSRFGDLGKEFASRYPVYVLEVEPEIVAGKEVIEKELLRFLI